MPLISVIMSVFNGELYLNQAIESIVNQTFDNFEFLIADDNSNIETKEILLKWAKADHRIKIFTNQTNLGLAASLNILIQNAQGQYLARMDADDISDLNRLKNQYDFLEQNNEISIVGTYISTFGAINKTINYPILHNDIFLWQLKESGFAHPSVMIKKQMLLEHHYFYNEKFGTAQDFELWSRLSFDIKLSNLPKVLLKYRVHNSNISTKNRTKQIANANIARHNRFQTITLGTELHQSSYIFKALIDNNSQDISNEKIINFLSEFHFFLTQNQNFSKQQLINYIIGNLTFQWYKTNHKSILPLKLYNAIIQYLLYKFIFKNRLFK